MFGVPSLYVGLELLVGVVLMGTAVRFALHPSDRTLALVRPLSLGTLFSGLGGTLYGLTVVLTGAAATETWSAAGRMRLLAGTAEAAVPIMAACSMLAVAWTLASVGMVRQR